MKTLISFTLLICSLIMPVNASVVDNYSAHLNQHFETVNNATQFNNLIDDINSKFAPKPLEATRFYFVRHGLSTANKYRYFAGHSNTYWENGIAHPIVLTEEGILQAQKRAQAIFTEQQQENWQFSAAFSSSTLRAQETATHILHGIHQSNIPLQMDDLVIERSNGKLEGTKKDASYLKEEVKFDQNVASLHTSLEKFLAKTDPDDAKEENQLQVLVRMGTFLTQRAAEPSLNGKHILVVSHAMSKKTLFAAEIAYKYNLNMEEANIQNVNGSVLIVDVYDEDHIEIVKVVGYNFKPYP